MEASNKSHPTLPANYVTILDLKQRWIQQQNQNKPAEDEGNKSPQLNSEVQDDSEATSEDEGVGDFSKVERKNPQTEKSLLRSNSNARSLNRRLSHGSRRPTETSSRRWVEVCQPSPAPSVQAKQPKPLPVRRVSRSKNLLPLETPNVESGVDPCSETNTSGKPKNDSEVKEKKKKPKRKKKRNDEKDGVQLQPEKGVKEPVPKQGIEVVRGYNDVDGEARAEIGGKLAGMSLNSGESMGVRNHRRFGKEKEGGYGRFQGRAVIKERVNRESGSVWVKKSEAS